MSVDLSLVRTLIGDTDATNYQLSDYDIEALTAGFSSNYLAAATCADALAGKFARSVTFAVEGLRIENSTKFEHYQKLAQRLRTTSMLSEAGGLGVPVVTGVSKGEMAAVVADPDREPGRFRVGMQDYPGSGIASGNDDSVSDTDQNLL